MLPLFRGYVIATLFLVLAKSPFLEAAALEGMSPPKSSLVSASRSEPQLVPVVDGVNLKGINSYEQVVKWLRRLERDHSFVNVYSLGATSENRSLLVVEINPAKRSGDIDMGVTPNSLTRPRTVFLDGGTHGREQITVTVAMALINKLVDTVTGNDTSDYTKVKWYIAPIVNPDGYEYSRTKARSWRKNRSAKGASGCTGVDVNRNWDYRWGADEEREPKKASGKKQSDGMFSSVSWLFKSILSPQNTVRQLGLISPCSELYAGHRPFSEAESRLLSDFILNLTRKPDESLESCFSLHSMTGGQELLFPYGYTTEQVPDYAYLKALSRQMAAKMEKVAGRHYQYGSVAETLYQSTGLQADWLYAVAGVNRTFVVEMRDNYRINPTSLITMAFDELWAALGVLLQDIIV